MDRARKTAWVIVAFGCVSVSVLSTLYWFEGWQIETIVGAAILVVFATGAEVWVVAFRDRPHLVVRPLPHYKGWTEPSEREEDYLLVPAIRPGRNPTLLPREVHATHPERLGHGIHLSQVYVRYWMDPEFHPSQSTTVDTNVPLFAQVRALIAANHSLILKFGVLGVRNSGADAEGCRATARYRLPAQDRWWEMGRLNWYDPSVRVSLDKNIDVLENIYNEPAVGISSFLPCDSVTISEGEEAYLPLFYMRLGLPYVYVTGNSGVLIAGEWSGGEPFELEIELSLTAKHVAAATRRYLVRAKWDDFRIEEVRS